MTNRPTPRAAFLLLLGCVSCLADCLFVTTGFGAEFDVRPKLIDRNVEAPFCYLPGTRRKWRILDGSLNNATITLTARQNGNEIAQGRTLEFAGLSISVSPVGRLRIENRCSAWWRRHGPSVVAQSGPTRPMPVVLRRSCRPIASSRLRGLGTLRHARGTLPRCPVRRNTRSLSKLCSRGEPGCSRSDKTDRADAPRADAGWQAGNDNTCGHIGCCRV